MRKSSRIKIYIAEDESIILMNFKMILQQLGYEVVGSSVNGEKALKDILELKPDLLLLDINMPRLDGISLFESVSKAYDAACIFITGHFSEAFVEKAKKAGALGYLIKPVDEKQLKASIEVAVACFDERCILRDETEKLRADLSDRKYIERAKGILMDSFGLKEGEAMARLQKLSRDKNKKLAVIARELIEKEKIMMR
ncbi:ANTAR domain-containing response regulator [Enterocloster bolteae]|uniref:ANTAR domain-containing response regulator n=1 Tax=Enterocloster bolteae TaxID=208479 RepID=UPI000E42F233|nr:response regulator [Enterocloster bolteae]RGK68582.1 response regulator [Enterocloster bolteae]